MTVRPVLFAAVVLLAVACGGGDTEDEPGAGPTSPVPPPGLQQQIEDGRELVAERAGVPAAEVELIVAQEVTWPNGALGCPEPDGVYTQALVEGYQIEFEVAGETYFVHGSEQAPAFICDDPEEPADGGTS